MKIYGAINSPKELNLLQSDTDSVRGPYTAN
jgi:hypothetical protein